MAEEKNTFKPQTLFEVYICGEFKHLKEKVDDIKNNHLPSIYRRLNRPSWSVAIIITALTSLSVGLMVVALMRGG